MNPSSFPLAILSAINSLSASHMANSLQYASFQISTYLAIAENHLCNIGPGFIELETRPSAAMVKQIFEEKMDLLAGEKMSAEEQIVTFKHRLDVVMQRCEDLDGENKGLAKKLTVPEKVLGESLARLPHCKG
ncbi:hypothetical protein LXL04_016196 [Taraxacum kok-saghyz]